MYTPAQYTDTVHIYYMVLILSPINTYCILYTNVNKVLEKKPKSKHWTFYKNINILLLVDMQDVQWGSALCG